MVRAQKPRCCWSAKRTAWAVSHHVGKVTRLMTDGRCRGSACFDWPVCRQHVQAWADKHPFEAASLRPVWAAKNNFDALPYRVTVTVTLKINPRCGATGVIVLMPSIDDALAIADWYDLRGDIRSASLLRIAALNVKMRGDPRWPKVYSDLLMNIHTRQSDEASPT